MRTWPWSTALLALAGCVQLTTGTDAGSSSATGTTSPSTANATAGAGTGCFDDPTGEVTLCEGLTSCPGVTVDPGVFPNCGFRQRAGGPALDLECLCSDQLCPIGVPASCADAQQLLAAQNDFTVCEGVDEGRCVDVAGAEAGTSAGSSTCDRACADDCAGAPSCIQLCGC